MMIYGVTTLATDFSDQLLNNWWVRFIKTLLFFVPRSNPDVERLYPQVESWALELSDDGWPQREVGLDKAGKPLFATPTIKTLASGPIWRTNSFSKASFFKYLPKNLKGYGPMAQKAPNVRSQYSSTILKEKALNER